MRTRQEGDIIPRKQVPLNQNELSLYKITETEIASTESTWVCTKASTHKSFSLVFWGTSECGNGLFFDSYVFSCVLFLTLIWLVELQHNVFDFILLYFVFSYFCYVLGHNTFPVKDLENCHGQEVVV